MEYRPSKTEVKLAVVARDTAKAMDAFGVEGPPMEGRRVYFFDTPGQELFAAGLILRVRKSLFGDDESDVTVKVRGDDAAKVAEEFMADTKGKAKLEEDQNVGKTPQAAFSITWKLGENERTPASVESLLGVMDEKGRELVKRIAGTRAGAVKAWGPIRSWLWKIEPEPGKGKLTVELWGVAGVQLLEISDKVVMGEAQQLEKRLAELVKGVRQLPESKTRFALTLLSTDS